MIVQLSRSGLWGLFRLHHRFSSTLHLVYSRKCFPCILLFTMLIFIMPLSACVQLIDWLNSRHVDSSQCKAYSSLLSLLIISDCVTGHFIAPLKRTCVTSLTQVGHPGKSWVKADLLDFVCASHEEVNDPVSHNTVGEALDDMMESPSHV